MPIKRDYTDKTPFPFGRYQGLPMDEVPADYIMELYDEGKMSGPMRRYVEQNMDVLNVEIAEIDNENGEDETWN